MFNKLDLYISKAFAVRYILAVTAIMGLFVILDSIERLPAITRTSKGFEAALLGLEYYLSHTPLFLIDFSPAFSLVAGVWTLSELIHRNELMAMQTSGISSRRALLSLVFAAAAPVGIIWVAQEVAGPHIVTIYQSTERTVRNRDHLAPIPNIIVIDKFNRPFRIDRYLPLEKRLTRIWVFPSGESKRRIYAIHGSFKSDGILLEGVTWWDTSHSHRPKNYKDKMFVKTDLSEDILMRKRNIPQFLKGNTLLSLADRLKGWPEERILKTEFHRRFADIAVSGGLLLLAIPLVVTMAYSGAGLSLAWWVSIALERGMPLLVFAVFYIAKLIAESTLPAAWAVWVPAAGIALIGVITYTRGRF